MENINSVKRKHFRFPAYDDDMGVKLVYENPRELFKDYPILTQVTPKDTGNPNGVDSDIYGLGSRNYMNKVGSQTETDLSAYTKTELPNYMLQKNKAHAEKEKKSIFSGNKKVSIFRKSSAVDDNEVPAKIKKDTEAESRQTFVPKSVPNSILSEETFINFSEDELVNSMKKDKSSYLLFDDEPTAFQVKKREEDSTVKRFNIPNESLDIPVTRRQYQQIKPNIQKFDKEDLNHTLPRSRKELKNAKENAKTQTAYGKKMAEHEKEVKSGILDKSLSGIIEESTSEMKNSKYFN